MMATPMCKYMKPGGQPSNLATRNDTYVMIKALVAPAMESSDAPMTKAHHLTQCLSLLL